MHRLRAPFAMLLLLGVMSGAAVKVRADAPSGFSVQFTDCVETIGVGLIPTDLARALVPPEFVLVGEESPVTPIVARTFRAHGIAVAGHKPKAGAIVQIGLVILPPDFTGNTTSAPAILRHST
jgi:hypothetical protein